MDGIPLVVVYSEGEWGGDFGWELEEPHLFGVDFHEEWCTESGYYMGFGLEILGRLGRDHEIVGVSKVLG